MDSRRIGTTKTANMQRDGEHLRHVHTHRFHPKKKKRGPVCRGRPTHTGGCTWWARQAGPPRQSCGGDQGKRSRETTEKATSPTRSELRLRPGRDWTLSLEMLSIREFAKPVKREKFQQKVIGNYQIAETRCPTKEKRQRNKQTRRQGKTGGICREAPRGRTTRRPSDETTRRNCQEKTDKA